MNRYFDGRYKISREYSNKYIASIPVYILQIINFNSYLLPRWDRVARNMFWRDNLPVGIEHVCSFIVKCTSCFYLGFMIDTCFNIFYPIHQQHVFRHTLIVLSGACAVNVYVHVWFGFDFLAKSNGQTSSRKKKHIQHSPLMARTHSVF